MARYRAARKKALEAVETLKAETKELGEQLKVGLKQVARAARANPGVVIDPTIELEPLATPPALAGVTEPEPGAAAATQEPEAAPASEQSPTPMPVQTPSVTPRMRQQLYPGLTDLSGVPVPPTRKFN